MCRHDLNMAAAAGMLIISACATLAPETETEAKTFSDAETTRAVIDDLSASPAPSEDPASPEAEDGPLSPTELAALIWRITDDRKGLEHLASGYVCATAIDSFSLTGDEAFRGLGRGNDVACLYDSPQGANVKLHLTNFGRSVSPAAHLKGVEANLTETGRIADETVLPSTLNADAIQNAAAFTMTNPDVGPPLHTAVWIEKIGEWHIKARATYAPDQSEDVGRFVSVLISTAYTSIDAAE
ncbi:MAG: hypothetical protein ABJG15_08920 [Hyphomonadaceae bacterium]